MKYLFTLGFLVYMHSNPDEHPLQKTITEQGMELTWNYANDRIHFEMAAPTSGWLCIGFNDGPSMTGAYLLMGRIVDGSSEVVAHYTQSPGNYKPLSKYGLASTVQNVSGEETVEGSILRFSLPTTARSDYARNLHSGTVYTLTLAYSRSDDFDHHSAMRTSVQQEL